MLRTDGMPDTYNFEELCRLDMPDTILSFLTQVRSFQLYNSLEGMPTLSFVLKSLVFMQQLLEFPGIHTILKFSLCLIIAPVVPWAGA